MRRPRIRLTVATMMIVVAAPAVAIWLCLTIKASWSQWLDTVNVNPLLNSHLQAKIENPMHKIFVGDPIHINVTHDFAFSKSLPPPGMCFKVDAEIQIWDMDRGKLIGEHQFQRTLIAGVWNQSSGERDFRLRHASAGSYCVRDRLSYVDFLGRRRKLGEGGHFYEVRARESTADDATVD